MAADLLGAAAALGERERAWHAAKSYIWGIDTGLTALNRITGGIQPGVTVVGARTSHGKSAFTIQLATTVSHRLLAQWLERDCEGVPPGLVIVVTPEMRPEQVVSRYASAESRVPVKKIKRGRASAEERQAWLQAANDFALLSPVLELHAGMATTFEAIEDRLNEAHAEAKAGVGPPITLVVVDYIQRLRTSRVTGAGSGQDYQALSAMANGFKDLATRLDISIILAAQLNRSIEKDNQGGTQERPPEMSDIQGSGVIEQAADGVWLLWNPPEEAVKDGTGARRSTIFVRKDRDGEVGDCRLLFHPRIVRFEDLPGTTEGD